MHIFTNDGFWSDLSCTGRSQLVVTSLTKTACQIRTPWFASQFAGIWKIILKIWGMGFVRNSRIYMDCKKIAKQSHGLWYTCCSLRGYFPDLLLWPGPNLLAVTAVFQLLQITSWGFSSSFPWDNFMYKYLINLIEKKKEKTMLWCRIWSRSIVIIHYDNTCWQFLNYGVVNFHCGDLALLSGGRALFPDQMLVVLIVGVLFCRSVIC